MSLTSIKTRHLAPNWRSPYISIQNGEMDGIVKSSSDCHNVNIDGYINNWRKHKTVPYAGELLSVAYTNNLDLNGGTLNEALDYLRKHINNPKSVHGIISRILNNKTNDSHPNYLEFSEESWRNVIIKKIKEARLSVHESPYNAVNRIELARAYLSMGLNEKAENEAKTAVHLIPDNRYITRCAVRCFIHVGKPDLALYVLRKNPWLKKDPWLLAAETTVNTIKGKNPSNIKIVRHFLESKSISPYALTELAMAMATFERNNGTKVKVLKQLVSLGLKEPNDNSLAQAEWLYQQERNLILPEKMPAHIPFNYEAETLHLNDIGQYDDAYRMSLNWLRTSNFSRRASLMASSIASINLGKREEAINLLKIGLISNPNNEILLNNIAYLLLLDNDVREAKKSLSKISMNNLDLPCSLCVQATLGLLDFRNGNIKEGTNKYKHVMEIAHKMNILEIEQIAHMNLLREQVFAKITTSNNALDIIDSMNLNGSDEISMKYFITNDIQNHCHDERNTKADSRYNISGIDR